MSLLPPTGQPPNQLCHSPKTSRRNSNSNNNSNNSDLSLPFLANNPSRPPPPLAR